MRGVDFSPLTRVCVSVQDFEESGMLTGLTFGLNVIIALRDRQHVVCRLKLQVLRHLQREEPSQEPKVKFQIFGFFL